MKNPRLCHCFASTYTSIHEHHRRHTCESTTASVAPATKIKSGCTNTGYDPGGHSHSAQRVCECDRREPYFRPKTPTHRYRPCLMCTWGLRTFAFSLGVLGISELRTKSVNLLPPRTSQGVRTRVAGGTRHFRMTRRY